MEINWIILGLIFVLVAAMSNPRTWGRWTHGSWHDLFLNNFESDAVDTEIRAIYRERAMEHLPEAEVCHGIKFSDPTIDRLIYEGDYEAADRVRMEKVREARDSRDRDALENYTAYKSIIAAEHAMFQERTRQTLRTRMKGSVKSAEDAMGAGITVRDDPMEILEVPGKPECEKEKVDFLELKFKGFPRRYPKVSDTQEEIRIEESGKVEPVKQSEPALTKQLIFSHSKETPEEVGPKEDAQEHKDDFTDLIKI